MGKKRLIKHNKWTPHTNEAEEHGVIILKLTASKEFLQGAFLTGIAGPAFLPSCVACHCRPENKKLNGKASCRMSRCA